MASGLDKMSLLLHHLLLLNQPETILKDFLEESIFIFKIPLPNEKHGIKNRKKNNKMIKEDRFLYRTK